MIKPIVIKVTDKVPELVSGPEYVVCDNSDYTVVWQFDEEWAQFEHRTMQVNYKDGTYERVLFTGDACALPAIPVRGPVHVGLFAGDIHTTRPARLLAVRSAITDSGEERTPMPNGYAQAIEALDGKLDKNQGAENAGKALVVDAEGNVVPGEAGGSDLSLGITSAAVGQLVKITEVDADGKPTAWKAVDDRLPKVNSYDGNKILAAGRIGESEYGYFLDHKPTIEDFIPLGITDASPGQFARVKYVDDYGGPTAWEAADMPTGGGEKAWTKIIDVEITEATMVFEAAGLDNVTELYCEWAGLKTASETAKRFLSLYVNDINVGNDWVNNQPSNGQYVLGYSISKYSGIVWYNVKSAGLVGSYNTFKTDMGGTARISYMLARDVGAATSVKIKAFNADNAPVTGQIRVWAR